jgi:hypothetical protein
MSSSKVIRTQPKSALYVSDMKTKLFLVCGAIAGPFFTIAWFVEGLTRANYDPMRHPISSLSIGEFGWTQAANFIITGILTIALALGLRSALQSRGGSKWGPILVGIIGIGFLGAGFFVTDPMNGYPLGTPALPAQFTVVGRLHRLFSAFFFLGLPIACFVLARLFTRQGEHNWALYSRVTGVTFIVMFIVTTVGFSQVEGLVDYAGLLQRITVTIGLTWLTLLPIYLLKRPQEFNRVGGN